jgi:hypothetical protein
MKRIYMGIVLAVFLQGLAPMAFADTDQRCLSLCMDAGYESNSCLGQCSSVQTPSSASDGGQMSPSSSSASASQQRMPGQVLPSQITAPTPAQMGYVQAQQHNVFAAPQPFEGIMLAPPASAASANLQTGANYQCVAECLHEGMQHSTCERLCTPKACLPNEVLCRSATLSSASFSGPLFPPQNQAAHPTPGASPAQ